MNALTSMQTRGKRTGMPISMIRTTLAVLLLATLAACGGMSLGKSERSMVLDAAVNNYRKLIRWGYYDEAAKYLRSADGKPFAADLKTPARYRVTNYTVSNQFLSDDGREARVIAIIDYYELDSGIIRSLHDAQRWWYDAKGKRWYLASPLPHFGVDDEDAAPAATQPAPAKP